MLFADVRKSKQSYKDTSMVHGSVSTGGGVIFQADVVISIENAKFLTI